MKDILGNLYHVEAKEKDSAKILIRFLNCPYMHYKEVNIHNIECKNNPRFKRGLVFPDNLFSVSYSDENIPSEEELMDVLSKNEFGFSAVGALDEDDMNRISMICFGNKNSVHTDLPFCKDRFILAPSGSDITTEDIHKIIKYLEG